MFYFYTKEIFKSIRRAKTSFLLSLLSMSIAVTLIMASYFIYLTSQSVKTDISKSLVVNVFLKDSVGANSISALEYKLKTNNAVNSFRFINKDEAARIFVKETGEDFKKVLDYNPLPASYNVILKEDFLNNNGYIEFIKEIKNLDGIEEVVYQKDLVNKTSIFLNSLNKTVIVLSIIILLISIYIIYSTIKLILNLRMEEIDTMKLVGAKIFTIKFPIIMNGILIGLLAGLISLGSFYGINYFLEKQAGFFSFKNLLTIRNVLILLSIGPLLGFLVSIFTLKKIKL